jgi:hypothetical protein
LQAELLGYAKGVHLHNLTSFILQHDLLKDEFNKKLLERFEDTEYVSDSIRQYIAKQFIYFLEEVAEKIRKEINLEKY